VPIVDGGGKDAPRATARREYYPYDLTGTPPKNPRVNTPDAAAEPVRAAALRRARDTGNAQTTEPVTTFRDKIRALLVFVPVYDAPLPPATVARRRATLRGYAVGILPLNRLVHDDQAGSVTLLDGGRRIAGARHLENATTVPVELAGRRFQLRVATGIVADQTLAVAIGVGGLLLALMIGTVLAILLRREAYAQRLVKQRLAEQRKAEVALEESERRHRLLAEHSNDWITVIDANGLCTYSSPSGNKLLGRAAADVMGKPFTELVHPDDLAAAAETLTAIGRGGAPQSVELRQRHADGHWVPLETTITVVRDENTQAVIEVQCASRDVTERHELEEQLRKLAVEDTLTGLPNRRGLTERLESELALSRRYGGGALVMFDLDGFKQVNDTLGHACGDEVLCRVADVLRENTRESDHLTRLGGDEFTALLPRVGEAGADTATDAILAALRTDDELQRLFGHPVTASAGIALMTGAKDQTVENLLLDADRALYAAKGAGRDQKAAARSASVS
jgi:diguanylate cyclase (GGDEF)-like protein/PAS domain S-box-containing protein